MMDIVASQFSDGDKSVGHLDISSSMLDYANNSKKY